MTQEQANAIIQSIYGSNAYAIGTGTDTQGTAIFWLYQGESEDDFKVHEVTP